MELKTILLIEDDEAVRNMVKTALEMKGYHVVPLNSADHAQDMIRDFPINLVLLDLNLGRAMSGNDFMEWLRFQKPIPVVLMTGYLHRLENNLRSIPAGIVQKPFKINKLLAEVENALAIQEQVK